MKNSFYSAEVGQGTQNAILAPRTETDGGSSGFASEPELQEVAGEWLMKRLIEIWNRLPEVEPVTRFTDRKTAIRRIWRAIQPQTDKGAKTARRASSTRVYSPQRDQ